MKYAVIVDNNGGPNLIYHDVTGEVYTFPKQYQKILQEGTKVIYMRSAKKKDSPEGLMRLMKEAHYFGTAVIGKIVITEGENLRADILDYKQFKYGVPFSCNGKRWEIIKGLGHINGVREISEDIYNAIVAASSTPPSSKPSPKRKTNGARSTKVLTTWIESKLFHENNLKVVTGSEGYYLYSAPSAIYYELIKNSSKELRSGEIKILRSGSSFVIIHNYDSLLHQIGIIDIVENGVNFTPSGGTNKDVIAIKL